MFVAHPVFEPSHPVLKFRSWYPAFHTYWLDVPHDRICHGSYDSYQPLIRFIYLHNRSLSYMGFRFSVNSINKKILYAGSLSLLVVAGVIILFAAISTYTSSIYDAEKELQILADSEAEKVISVLDEPMSSAEALSEVMLGPYSSGKPISRNDVISVIGGIMKNHPLYNGVYTMWEADAYDKADARYAGIDGYAGSGRMNVYWYREGDVIERMIYDGTSDDVVTDYGLDYYTIPAKSHQKTLTNPYVEEALNPPVLMASTIVPIMYNDTFLGITGVDVTLADIDRIADESNLYDGQGILAIISNDGTIAGISGDIGKVGEPFTSIAPALGISEEELTTLLSDSSGNTLHLGHFVGDQSEISIGDPSLSWKAFVFVPSGVLTASAISLTIILVIFGILISAGGIILLFFVARSITRPIQQITTAATRLAEGDLSCRTHLIGDDEVAVLGRTFDTMASRLEETMEKVTRDGEDQAAVLCEINGIAQAASNGNLNIRGDISRFGGEYRHVVEAVNNTLDAVVDPVTEAMRLAVEYSTGNFAARFDQNVRVCGDFISFRSALDSIGVQLGELFGDISAQIESLMTEMEESNASVEEIASASQAIARGTNELSIQANRSMEGITHIRETVLDVTMIGSDIAGQTAEASTLVTTSQQLSEKGSESSQLADDGMRSIVLSHDETERIIGEITSEMDKIGDIVRIITDIADQTNLLALNAAIEAARAGEAGKGFSVVAGEVKALALESQKSAEKISGIISLLQGRSNLMKQAINVSRLNIENGSTAVHDTLQIFSDLAFSIDDIAKRIVSIDNASQNQMAAYEKVKENIALLNEAFHKTINELGNTAALTEENSVSLDCIAQSIQEATNLIDKISRDMTQFKI